MDARAFHPPVCILSQLWRRRPTGLGIGPDAIPGLAQTQSQKHGADFGHDPAENDLLATGGLDGRAEFRVVPGVDLAAAFDQRRVRVHLGDFFGQGTVGACLGRSRHDHWEAEDFAEFGVSEDIVAELGRRVVFH